jgi:hypothetical protein
VAKLSLVKGTTSYRSYLFLLDSSVTTGAGKTGLAYNTAGLVAYYVRPGAAATAITLVTQTATGAYSSGGFVEVDATNMPGVYRLDVPDAALATGVNAVVVMLKGAANMASCVLEVELTGIDNQNVTTGGLGNLDAAISTRSTYAGGAVASVTAGVTVTTNNDKTGYGLSAAAVQAIWDALTSALTTVGSIGKRIADNLDATISGRASASALTTAQADLDDIQTRLPAALISGRMDASVGAMAANVMTAAAAAADLTTELQTGLATAVSITTLTGYVDTEVAAIKAKTDNLPASPAAVSDIPTATQNADALLKRDMTAVTGEAARSPLNAIRFLRNKWSVSGATLTVTKEDDTTAAWTATLATDAAADPVVGSDPT